MKKTTKKTTVNKSEKQSIVYPYSEKDVTITYCKDYDPYLDDSTDAFGIKMPNAFLEEMEREKLYYNFKNEFSY